MTEAPTNSGQDVEIHRPRLERLATRILVDPHAAADVVQDAILAFLRRRDEITSPLAWLMRCVSNGARDRIRSRRRRFEDGDPDATISAWPDPTHLVGHRDEGRKLLDILDSLPSGQRSVVLRRIVHDMTYREIASELGISQGAAKKHFARGIKSARRRLGVVR